MPDPNNIILPEYNLAFMLVPKNANTAVKYALFRTLKKSDRGSPHNPRHFIYTNKMWIKGRNGWLKIAVKRNPYNRIVSCWREKVMNDEGLHNGFKRYSGIEWKQPFHEFLEAVWAIPDWMAEQHFRSQTYELFHGEKQIPNLIGTVENLKADWKKIQQRVKAHCGLELSNLAHEYKTSETIPYPELTGYERDLIQQRYARDFRLLNYET